MSTFTYHKPGIGNASSYIVSGVPWYTSSLAPALSTTSKVVNFPRVTNYVVVKNNSTTDDTLRFTFNNDNIVDNTNYITLEGGESFSGELRTTDVHFISDTETPVPFTVVAGLTNIERQEMTQTTPTAPNLLAWVQKQKLIANDPDGSPEGDSFGGNAVIYFNEIAGKIFVSSTAEDLLPGESISSNVYVFEEKNGNYVQTQKIRTTSSVDDPYGSYPFLVGANSSGSRIFLTKFTSDFSGEVHVYESGSSGYEYAEKVTPDVPAPTDWFAATKVFTSSDDNLLIAASANDSSVVAGEGSVYIFQSSSMGYQQIQKITASYNNNGTPYVPSGVQFGFRTLITQDLQKLFISAPQDKEAANSAGAVYIYESSSMGYQISQKLTSSLDFNGSPRAPAAFDFFGRGMAITPDGNTLVVGATADDENGANAGAVYIFQSGSQGYQQVQKFSASFNSDGTPETSPEGDQLGGNYSYPINVSISEDGTIISVAALEDEEDGGPLAGAVYIYETSSIGYVQQEKLLSFYNTDGTLETPEPGQDFGYASILSRDGRTLVVSATGDSENGVDSGAVYIFKYTRDY